jgi:ribokinase
MTTGSAHMRRATMGAVTELGCRPLLVIGDGNPDLVVRSGDVTPRFGQAEMLVDHADLVMGGSATIMACGAARLDVPTSFVGVVGDDFFGRFVIDTLNERSVSTEHVVVDPATPTGLSVILSSPADRAILTRLGTIPALRAEMIDPDWFPVCGHLHAASFFLLPDLASGLAAVFRRARDAGCTTSLDTNWDPSERWNGVREVLDVTDVFFPNENELQAVGGDKDLGMAAESLAAHGCLIAVKCGSTGGRLWGPGGLALSAAPPNVDVVDTTGAGDSFDAGFLAAWLRGRELDECLRAAVVAGSLSTRGAGGIGTQATWTELAAVAELG